MDRSGVLLKRTSIGLVRLQHNASADYTYDVSSPLGAECKSFFIINDGAADITILITLFDASTFTFTIKAGESFDEVFDRIASVAITANAQAYRSYLRG